MYFETTLKHFKMQLKFIAVLTHILKVLYKNGLTF